MLTCLGKIFPTSVHLNRATQLMQLPYTSDCFCMGAVVKLLQHNFGFLSFIADTICFVSGYADGKGQDSILLYI